MGGGLPVDRRDAARPNRVAREVFVVVFEIQTRQTDVAQIVLALSIVGGLAYLLDCRQQQTDQNGDDGDHHQQLDQRETAAPCRPGPQRPAPQAMTTKPMVLPVMRAW